MADSTITLQDGYIYLTNVKTKGVATWLDTDNNRISYNNTTEKVIPIAVRVFEEVVNNEMSIISIPVSPAQAEVTANKTWITDLKRIKRAFIIHGYLVDILGGDTKETQRDALRQISGTGWKDGEIYGGTIRLVTGRWTCTTCDNSVGGRCLHLTTKTTCESDNGTWAKIARTQVFTDESLSQNEFKSGESVFIQKYSLKETPDLQKLDIQISVIEAVSTSQM